MGWLTVDEFKTLTGITIDDDIIEAAIVASYRQIVKKIFISQRYQYGTSVTQHVLDYTPVADTDADGEITKADVDAWEEDSTGTVYNEYDLNDHVLTVVNTHRQSIVTFDTSVPTSSRTLYIDYKITRDDIALMIDELKELQKYLMIDYLFDNVPFAKLQRGISSWSLNGVSVSFDLDAMQKIKEQNVKVEKRLFDQCRRPRADGIAIGKRFHDSLDRKRHGLIFR